jgi:hypothetical protein
VSARTSCVCGCGTPEWNGTRLGLESPGVCTCGHYLYPHYRDQLEDDDS